MEPTSSKNKWNIGDIIRAPGKIVLAGEYAVLDGAPAIVLAINRGVECEIAKGSGFVTPMNDTRFIPDTYIIGPMNLEYCICINCCYKSKIILCIQYRMQLIGPIQPAMCTELTIIN